MKKIVSLILLMLILGSCSLFRDKTQPMVLSVKPLDGSTDMDPKVLVEICFSKPMEKPITEKAFSLKREGTPVEGVLSWDSQGEILFFRPSSPLARGYIYYCEIGQSAEDKYGNDLVKKHRFSFSLNQLGGKPSLVGTYPVCGATGIELSTNILLYFSDPVDMHSLPSGISISPSIEVRFISRDGGRTVVLDPILDLKNGTRYSVRLTTSVKNTNGISIPEEHQFYFTAGNDAVPPLLHGVGIWSNGQTLSSSGPNNGVEKTDSLLFRFSEPMRLDTAYNGIYFQPSVSGRFSEFSISNILFTPDEPFQLGQVYGVNISTSLCDLSENRLSRASSYSFVIDGSNSLPVQVLKVSNGNSPQWIQNQYISLGAGGTSTNICINFSSPMKQASTVTKVGIRYLFGGGASGVQISSFQWKNSGRTLRIDLRGLDSGNTYRLTVEGTKEGVSDTRENYMLQDFMIDLKT